MKIHQMLKISNLRNKKTFLVYLQILTLKLSFLLLSFNKLKKTAMIILFFFRKSSTFFQT